jgi:hypothetical protein
MGDIERVSRRRLEDVAVEELERLHQDDPGAYEALVAVVLVMADKRAVSRR